jgi:hypothetical protein
MRLCFDLVFAVQIETAYAPVVVAMTPYWWNWRQEKWETRPQFGFGVGVVMAFTGGGIKCKQSAVRASVGEILARRLSHQ